MSDWSAPSPAKGEGGAMLAQRGWQWSNLVLCHAVRHADFVVRECGRGNGDQEGGEYETNRSRHGDSMLRVRTGSAGRFGESTWQPCARARRLGIGTRCFASRCDGGRIEGGAHG